MSEEHSLLAHLVQKLTPQVEDAATDALAYILNKSAACMNALADMVSAQERQLAPLLHSWVVAEHLQLRNDSARCEFWVPPRAEQAE